MELCHGGRAANRYNRDNCHPIRHKKITPKRTTGQAYLLLTLTALFWSGNWVVGRGIRGDVPPITLSFWRWVVHFALFLPIAWPYLSKQWRAVLRHWRVIAVLGVFGGACHNALTYIGLTQTTATNGVLLASATPIMILGLSWALLGKRLRRVEWAGVAVSLAGILIILAQGDPARLAALRPNAGDLWVLIAMLFWALYTVLLSRQPTGLHPFAFLAGISAVGLVALAPFYAWEMASGRLINPTFASWTAIAYAGVFPGLLGFIFWNKAVAEVGGNRAGVFMHLMPAFGTVLSILFLGERPHLFHLAGIGLILAGIWLTTRGKVQVGG